MALFAWDATKYSVKIPEIDRQHQKLFALLNDLYDAMQQGRGKDIMGKVLNSLIVYTAQHFAHEEQLFLQHGYPDAAAHRAEHLALTQQANALKQKFDTDQTRVTLDTLKFLRDWLNNHIMGSDKKYVEFLLAKGVR